jgi:PAS domain S-box-containing protein
MHEDTNLPDKNYSLREVEQHFTELVAGVEDHAIFLLDRNGIVKSWNEGAKRIKGYEAQEIIGQLFTKFYTPEALETGWPQEELRVAAAVGKFQDEGWRLRKDGSRIWANVVITTLRDSTGEVRGFLKITRDLTDRKQAEERLRQSEERLRLMIESVQDYAIFMLDPEGHIATWNLGAERIKGYQPAEIIGKHFSVFYSSEDVARGKPQQELEIAQRDGRVEDEGWRVRKDRSQFWANVIITALFDSQGVLRGFAKVTRDMTHKRRVEELQLADRHKNEFLAMLAHELRNPLAPIRNGIELLKIARGSQEIHETTRMMERQVVHLVRLVDDLLDVSRIITGKIHLEIETVDVNVFLERAIEEIQPAIDAGGHELMLSRPARPVIVEGDYVRLAQVVSNLLSNAAKYTDKPSQIWLSVEATESESIIRIRDNGIGMTSEELSRVFRLFEQADTSFERSRGGLGIGLTLVKKIVEMHGGSIVAVSAGRKQGSEFTIRLPLSTASPAHAKTVELTARAASSTSLRRILVVDDNVDAAQSVARLLQRWGHDVQTAFNGPNAIERAQAFRPQIVLLDIGMPGMSGYDVAKRLRAQPEFEGLVITALTGYGQAEDRRRSKEAGFNHHLTKPPDPVCLAALLESPHTFSADVEAN